MFSRTPTSALRFLDFRRICATCLRRLAPPPNAAQHQKRALTTLGDSNSRFAKQYFLSNNLWTKNENGQFVPRKYSHTGNGAVAQSLDGDAPAAFAPHTSIHKEENVLPHRRRKQRRKVSDTPAEDTANEQSLPPDASSQLSSLASASAQYSLEQRFYTYLSLSKPRLTALIVLTTTASYSLYPVVISPLAAHLTLSPWTLVTLTTGTALASASANAFNMLMEPEHDAKMSRTKTRPIVRGLVSKRSALVFAILAGTTGTVMLYYGVNPTVAGLGFLNIFLYAGVYTPLKRLSALNTWAGALVGGIPPLMGWAAAAGQATHLEKPTWVDLLFADDGSSAGGWLLAALLFAWQFPHFWALAHPIRQEYAAAGYRMLISSNIRMTGRSALRYSLAMFPICAGLSLVGVTSWWFVGASSIVNTWMVREAWRFWRLEGMKGSARGLFWASVWHLPLTLVLAMMAKVGMWERLFWGGLDAEEMRMWQEDEERPPDDIRRRNKETRRVEA